MLASANDRVRRRTYAAKNPTCCRSSGAARGLGAQGAGRTSGRERGRRDAAERGRVSLAVWPAAIGRPARRRPAGWLRSFASPLWLRAQAVTRHPPAQRPRRRSVRHRPPRRPSPSRGSEARRAPPPPAWTSPAPRRPGPRRWSLPRPRHQAQARGRQQPRSPPRRSPPCRRRLARRLRHRRCSFNSWRTSATRSK